MIDWETAADAIQSLIQAVQQGKDAKITVELTAKGGTTSDLITVTNALQKELKETKAERDTAQELVSRVLSCTAELAYMDQRWATWTKDARAALEKGKKP